MFLLHSDFLISRRLPTPFFTVRILTLFVKILKQMKSWYVRLPVIGVSDIHCLGPHFRA